MWSSLLAGSISLDVGSGQQESDPKMTVGASDWMSLWTPRVKLIFVVSFAFLLQQQSELWGLGLPASGTGVSPGGSSRLGKCGKLICSWLG